MRNPFKGQWKESCIFLVILASVALSLQKNMYLEAIWLLMIGIFLLIETGD